MIFFILFLFGLLVGSFLNVVVLRLERGENFVTGRSRCLVCEHALAWYDNIPLLSFLLLRRRCRYCHVALSWQYPLVEFMTACLFSGVGFLAPFFLGTAGLIFLGFLLLTLSIAVVITVYDIRFLAIPTVLLWVLNGTLVIALLTEKFLFPGTMFFPTLASSVWGAVVAGGFLALLVFVSKETWMGQGDIWIGTWAGALLGVELAQVYLTLSFALGAVVAILLKGILRKPLSGAVPFAPYLLAAAALIFVVTFLAPGILEFLSPWFLARIEG